MKPVKSISKSNSERFSYMRFVSFGKLKSKNSKFKIQK